MSGQLDIRSGGAIAVDTESLRAAADGFGVIATELDDVVRMLDDTGAQLERLSWLARGAARHTADVAAHTRLAADQARDHELHLRAAAAVYESAELEAELAAARAAGDTAAVRAIEDRQESLEAAFPHLAEARDELLRAHGSDWDDALVHDGVLAALLGGAAITGLGGLGILGFISLLGTLRGLGGGTIPPDAQLSGPPTPVRVTPLSSGRAAAPASVADALARIPGDGASRVRVETYAMRDGSKQHVVYIAGTQSNLAAADPWNNISNAQLYGGDRSASYQATLEALRASGAQPGDVVHAVGHSQGAMIAARLAVEGEFDTRTLLSAGSPVEAAVGESTLSVNLRHTDDPIVALATGGHAQTVGAPDSVIAQRDTSFAAGTRADAHHLVEYIDTAELLDASADPRVAAVREVLDELRGAASVTAVEYAATRVPATSSAGAG